eukprot:COSAG04_NODE_4139_length_2275_cov_1.747702_4_plen_100_part_00
MVLAQAAALNCSEKLCLQAVVVSQAGREITSWSSRWSRILLKPSSASLRLISISTWRLFPSRRKTLCFFCFISTMTSAENTLKCDQSIAKCTPKIAKFP